MIIKSLSDKRIIIEAKVNTSSIKLLVDTGSSVNILDTAKSKKLDFKPGRLVGHLTNAGNTKIEAYIIKNMEVIIADTFKVYQWVTYSLEGIKQSIKQETGLEIDGILGLPAIKELEMGIRVNEITIGY